MRAFTRMVRLLAGTTLALAANSLMLDALAKPPASLSAEIDRMRQTEVTVGPQIVGVSAQIVSESCDPVTGAIDPGELVTVSFALENTGVATSDLVATVEEADGVLSPSGPQHYGALNSGDPAVSRSFTFTADAQLACGDLLTATLALHDGLSDLGTVFFPFTLGTLSFPTTTTYSSGNLAVPILDNSTAEVSIHVPDAGVVADVIARVRLNHTFDSDLRITLVHPDGTEMNLALNRGAGGDNFGTGANDCSGTSTNFDDEATLAIGAGLAPFAGTFRPDESLSGLDGKPSNGEWKLRVTDDATLDQGVLGCVSLAIARRKSLCCPFTGGEPVIAAEPPASVVAESCSPGNGGADPDETVTVELALRNVGTAPTANLVATLLPGGGVLAPSGPQTYGQLTPLTDAVAVARPFTFTVTGTCGDTLTATLALQDGASNLGTVSFPILVGATNTIVSSFSNPGSIAVPQPPSTGASTGAPASPYPSTVNVAGVTDPVTRVTVALGNFSHAFPSDVDILLVGPGGQTALLMSDVGGGTDAVNVGLTFDDAVAASIGATVVSGTFQPTNFGSGDTFPAPAPAGPYGGQLAVFNGVNPNGTWSLYVVDDAAVNIGSIASGWTLAVRTESVSCCSSPCVLDCASVSAPNDPGTCGATVAFSTAATGSCGVVTATPPSGSTFPVGNTNVLMQGTRQDNSQTTCNRLVTVSDVEPPSGGITAPPDGACFDSTGIPVTVSSHFTDNCPGVSVDTQPPGPFSATGAYHVVATATDAGLLQTASAVDFAIDTTPPAVAITRPASDQTGTPPLGTLYVEFVANDNDGAPGGVVHEVVKLMDTCVLYDGSTFGDRDGLLSDEGTIVITKSTLCQAMARCGFFTLDYPKIRVEATDNPACAGNTGFAERIFRRRLLKTDACAH